MSVHYINLRSVCLNGGTEIIVILPDAASDPTRTSKIPVLWMLHGAGADCTEAPRYTSIERYANAHDLAVVCPSYYDGCCSDMLYGVQYYSYLSDELPKMIHYMFPMISDKQEDNFTAGVSMGAYGAFKLAMNYPDRYAASGLFAGPLDIVWIFKAINEGRHRPMEMFNYVFGSVERIEHTCDDAVYQAKLNAEKGVTLPKLYQFIGRQDPGYGHNIMTRDDLIAMGYDLTYEECDGGHDYALWDKYLERFLNWLPYSNNAGGKN